MNSASVVSTGAKYPAEASLLARRENLRFGEDELLPASRMSEMELLAHNPPDELVRSAITLVKAANAAAAEVVKLNPREAAHIQKVYKTLIAPTMSIVRLSADSLKENAYYQDIRKAASDLESKKDSAWEAYQRKKDVYGWQNDIAKDAHEAWDRIRRQQVERSTEAEAFQKSFEALQPNFVPFEEQTYLLLSKPPENAYRHYKDYDLVIPIQQANAADNDIHISLNLITDTESVVHPIELSGAGMFTTIMHSYAMALEHVEEEGAFDSAIDERFRREAVRELQLSAMEYNVYIPMETQQRAKPSKLGAVLENLARKFKVHGLLYSSKTQAQRMNPWVSATELAKMYRKSHVYQDTPEYELAVREFILQLARQGIVDVKQNMTGYYFQVTNLGMQLWKQYQNEILKQLKVENATG